MLLVNLLGIPMMNNIIEKYVKKYPDEINKVDGHEWTILEQCIKKNRVEAIKILLDNVANINCTKCTGCPLYDLMLASDNLHIIQILLEYDGIPYMITNKTKKIIENISLLNVLS